MDNRGVKMASYANCGQTQIPFCGATYPSGYGPALLSSFYCEPVPVTTQNAVPIHYQAVYPSPEAVMFATAYVWVETRFCRCMPTTGEVPAVSVNFFKTGTDPHYILACLQGTPIHLAGALNLYTTRIEHALTKAAAYRRDSSMPSSSFHSESHFQSHPGFTLEDTKHYVNNERDNQPEAGGELKVYLDPSMTVDDNNSGKAKNKSWNGENKLGNGKLQAQVTEANRLKIKPISNTSNGNSKSTVGNEQKMAKSYRFHDFQQLNQSLLHSSPRMSNRSTLSSVPLDIIQDRHRQRPPSFSPPCTAANFNILVNRITFLLLTSYKGTPFEMLSWLTKAKFTVDEYEEQMKVCISGSRRDVDLGAKVLKEVMIFIGNRFTHWFNANGKVKEAKPDAPPSSPVTPVQEQGRRPYEGAIEIATGQKHVTFGDLDNIENEKIEIDTDASDVGETVEQEQYKLKGKVRRNLTAQAKKKKKVGMKLLDNVMSNRMEKTGVTGSPTLQIILVDESETGKIIGYKGENIGRIEKDSGAYVQMTKINIVHLERRVRAIFFVGPLDSILRARRTVMETVRFCMLYDPENKEN